MRVPGRYRSRFRICLALVRKHTLRARHGWGAIYRPLSQVDEYRTGSGSDRVFSSIVGQRSSRVVGQF
jgi:hypothetical protein